MRCMPQNEHAHGITPSWSKPLISRTVACFVARVRRGCRLSIAVTIETNNHTAQTGKCGCQLSFVIEKKLRGAQTLVKHLFTLHFHTFICIASHSRLPALSTPTAMSALDGAPCQPQPQHCISPPHVPIRPLCISGEHLSLPTQPLASVYMRPPDRSVRMGVCDPNPVIAAMQDEIDALNSKVSMLQCAVWARAQELREKDDVIRAQAHFLQEKNDMIRARMHELQDKNDVIRTTNRLTDQQIAALRLQIPELQESQ